MTRGRLSYGVALSSLGPVDGLLRRIRLIEDLGYDTVWITDHGLPHDPWSVLAAAAGSTSRVKLGPGVVNPFTRHPAHLAAAAATLDELSSGRAVLGLGAGGTGAAMLGADRPHSAAVLRESIGVIRSLLTGARVSMDVGGVRARGAQLDFAPLRPDLPIIIGTRGPRTLELAGEVADGVIFGNVASVEGWRYCLGHLERGAGRAGRRLEDLTVAAWLYCSLAGREATAVSAVAHMVAATLLTSRPSLAQLGLDLPAAIAATVDEPGFQPTTANLHRVGGLVPPATVHRLALAGTPEVCRQQLIDLLAEVPQISNVVIVPFPSEDRTVEEVVGSFIDEVAVGRPG